MTVPIAVERNRQWSVTEAACADSPDLMLAMYPASFADWSVFASHSFRF